MTVGRVGEPRSDRWCHSSAAGLAREWTPVRHIRDALGGSSLAMTDCCLWTAVPAEVSSRLLGTGPCRFRAMGPVELVILLILVAIPVGAIYLVVRSVRTRRCPRCNSRVKNGVLVCTACGHEF